jgi:NADPH-dependent curcumin reductase CurA
MMNSLPATNRRIVFARRPVGKPTPDCFRLESIALERPAENRVLVRNDYLSVDPYIRMRMEEKDSYAPVMALGDLLVGRTVGQIVESHVTALGVGDWVVGRLGWQDYSIAAPAEVQKIEPGMAPLTAYLGSLGSTGITAWVGLMEFGRPKAGETVLVSAASGAVGSVVGQLAKRLGCRVVGIAGGARKCAVVVEEFGFDQCVDYKSGDFPAALATAVPEGVDVYFDNVGGVIFDTVLPLLNHFARVPLCGLVSQYNGIEPYRVKNLREVFNRRVTIRGFLLSDHRDLWPAATRELHEAYAAGALHYRESIADGLENAAQAFIDMLDGANIGKQLVRLRDATNQPTGADLPMDQS